MVTHVKPPRSPRSERADRILTHPVAGIALLLLLMGLGFQVIYTWAQPVMDAIDGTFSALGACSANGFPPVRWRVFWPTASSRAWERCSLFCRRS